RLVGRRHHAGEIVVRDDPLGDMEAGGDELRAGHGPSLRGRGDRRRFRPRPARWQGLMDLTVTRAQYDAVRAARHLPDVLKKVLDGASQAGDGAGYRLHLTYEEATALNELCAVGGTGGEARRVASWPDGVSDPVWLPDGTGVLVTSDIKWPADQEIDRRNGEYPTEARIWTELMWRHWDDWRAGKRQHLFLVSVADGAARDLSPVDHDVP